MKSLTSLYDFFKQELKSLEANRGYKQYERLLASTTWEEDLDDLIRRMCNVCESFKYIPDAEKMKIISQNVITDPEFTGFHAGIIFKWLNQAKAIYFREIAHETSKEKPGWKPLEGEERAKKYQEWIEAVGGGLKTVPQLSPTEVKREGKIDHVERVGTKHPSDSPEKVLMKELLHRASSIFYATRETFKKFDVHYVGAYSIYAEHQADAESIYNLAKAQFDKQYKHESIQPKQSIQTLPEAGRA